MRIHFEVVSAPHPHTVTGQLARTPSGSFFWDREAECSSDRAVLATHKGVLVGIQKFRLYRSRGRQGLKSVSTFVWPMYRGLGIAGKMWRTAIRTEGVEVVDVSVVSDRGKTLVETLSRQFPGIQFTLREDAGRALRTLKGRMSKGWPVDPKGKGRRKAA